MSNPIDYHPQPARPSVTRKIVVAIAWITAAGVVGFAALCLLLFLVIRTGGRDHASHPADVVLLRDGRKPVVSATAIPPGGTDTDSEYAGTVGHFVFVVRVGGKTYEYEGGPLLDDDGPHRFTFDIRNDGVTVKRRANESPFTYELPQIEPPTLPNEVGA